MRKSSDVASYVRVLLMLCVIESLGYTSYMWVNLAARRLARASRLQMQQYTGCRTIAGREANVVECRVECGVSLILIRCVLLAAY